MSLLSTFVTYISSFETNPCVVLTTFSASLRFFPYIPFPSSLCILPLFIFFFSWLNFIRVSLPPSAIIVSSKRVKLSICSNDSLLYNQSFYFFSWLNLIRPSLSPSVMIVSSRRVAKLSICSTDSLLYNHSFKLCSNLLAFLSFVLTWCGANFVN